MNRETNQQKKRSIKEVKRRLPKGAGILVDLPGGITNDFKEVLDKCQKDISLEGLNIPPIGIRRTRRGGMLLEVTGDYQEEKAKLLASRIKEVAGLGGERFAAPSSDSD